MSRTSALLFVTMAASLFFVESNASDLRLSPANIICRPALRAGQPAQFESNLQFENWVAEARRRGYTPEFCAAVLAGVITAPPPPMLPPTTKPESPSVVPIASDPLVASIQTLLSTLGFDPGLTDGVPGGQTSKAIAQFQSAIGDKVDGRPSEALKFKLQKAVAERNVRPPPQTTPTLPEAAKPVRKVVSWGSGFFISRDIVVTNEHVIEGCGEIRTGRSGAEIGQARVIAVSKSDDLAALKSDAPSDSYLGLRVGTPLKPAEPILVFGYPLAEELSSTGNITLGHITALTGYRDDSRYIQISAAIQPGNSGGPVLDESGRVVGVAQGSLVRGATMRRDTVAQNVNFAIRASTLSNFLEAHQISYEVSSTVNIQPTTGIATRASTASVQIICLK